MKRLEELAATAARKVGLTVSRANSSLERLPIEATSSDRATVDFIRPFTMTSAERVWSLLEAVRYVSEQKLEGDFAECGVWRGGSVMAMARKLRELGELDRAIWLYDTFSGMTAPTEKDIEASSGATAAELMETTAVGDGNNVWAYATKQDVISNLKLTGYPMDKFHLVEGDVAQTLKFDIPEKLSLLRLDTDWYESTRMGLEVLYPRLVPGGVCILDDYGHWAGARAAVDEYFEALGARPLMLPIDYSGRIFFKTA
jgi:hypothetical protein